MNHWVAELQGLHILGEYTQTSWKYITAYPFLESLLQVTDQRAVE